MIDPLAIWYRALRAEFGIEITGARDQDRLDLYNARKASGDPALEALKMVQFKDGKIFIVKKEAKLEDDDAAPLP